MSPQFWKMKQPCRARGARAGGNTGGKHFTVWVPRSVWCLNCLGGCYIL
ncbi:hypothetical protein PLAN_30464 [Planktothrix rubescens CCAP 1459/22]|uniref:Uncharacterized protein n=1 Tax=Planktothrix rubescens CCAP 1459/22 TaxID=329571 RepID=A0A6J7ZLE8_PLARU|nr:hypothetical protein PLAN_30464 [Planktothrix rubescens NIVA-CYA 18]